MRVKQWFFYYNEWQKKMCLKNWVTTLFSWAFWLAVTAMSVLVLWGVALKMYNTNLKHERNRCNSYGVTTERDAKYVHTAWGSWECFVSVDGVWVLREQVWANGQGGK